MNGVEFFRFLQDTFQQRGEMICEDFTFQEWLQTSDGGAALRFARCGNTKVIPKDILVAAWDADTYIKESWLMEAVASKHPDDSRIQLLDSLLRMCSPLREIQA